MLVFPERVIPPHATPVSEAELVVGEIYFQAVFVDDEMLVPELRPLAYLGWDLRNDGTGKHFFQDAASFAEGKKFDDEPPEFPVELHTYEADGLGGIHTFDLALEVLLRCALRRSKAPARKGNP